MRNLCRQEWIKTHLRGTEDDFKAYWNGLAGEEIQVHSTPSFFVHPGSLIHLSAGNKPLQCR